MKKCITIVSGGIDSVTLLYYLRSRRDQIALTYTYGQRHWREVECSKYHTEKLGIPHRIVDLTPIFEGIKSSALLGGSPIPIPRIDEIAGDPQPVTYVPFRNFIFLAVAAAIAEEVGAGSIAYGAHQGDLYGYWDTTPQFVSRFQSLLDLNRRTQIHLEAPFLGLTKGDILLLGFSLRPSIDYSHTWSCYRGEGRPCGVCPSCADRLRAFELAGETDPLEYE